MILNNYRSQNRTIKILSNQKNQKRQKQKKMIIVLKQNLSTEYPAFTAVPVPFTVNNDNSISVDLTDITHTTEDDLIIQNAGGYDSIKNPRIGGDDILEL